MELTKQAKDDLRNLRLEYERKELLFDLNYIRSLIEIIESEERFKNVLELLIVDDANIVSAESIYEKANKISSQIAVNVKRLDDYTSWLLNGWDDIVKPDDIKDAKNFFAMLTILHESGHTWQDLGLDDEEEVNRFYNLLSKRYYPHNIFYRFFGDSFSFERHANIDAHNVLIDVYSDSSLATISKTYYLNLIIYMYGRLSPTEKTQLVLLLPGKFDMSKVSTMKKLEVGFPIHKEIIKNIDNELILEARGEINFYECKNKILEIAHGIK